MHKAHKQMWTLLSQLPKGFPVRVKAAVTANLARARAVENQLTQTSDRAASALQTSAQAHDHAPASTDAAAGPAKAQILPETTSAPEHCPPSSASASGISPQNAKPDLAASLIIPICTDCPESQSSKILQDQGQFLARQERWAELSQLIRTADQNHAMTSNGLPEADLLSYGARADVVNAVEHALEEADNKGTAPWDSRVLIDGIMALEALRREHRLDSYLTALVALAHIDIAWVWRGAAVGKPDEETYLRRAAAHFERAAALMAPLEGDSHESAFLSATHCALYGGCREETLRVADAYGALIDQAPHNPRHMRALGLQMLPRANGSYAALELEARRTAARTQADWGAGGYTWVYFDAMAVDDQACARVDPQFFLDGLQDILCANSSQEMINLLAAYCGVALRQGMGSNPQADANRRKISEASRWLIRSHLRELHPLVWAHAAEGFDNNTRVTSLRRFAARGQAEAIECIAGIFSDEIDSGHKITFTPDGFDLAPG